MPIGSPSYTGGRNKRRGEKKREDSIYRLSVKLTRISRAERDRARAGARSSRFAIPDSRDSEIVLDKDEEHSAGIMPGLGTRSPTREALKALCACQTRLHTADPGGRSATDLPASCFVVGDSCSASRGTADTDGAAYSIRVALFDIPEKFPDWASNGARRVPSQLRANRYSRVEKLYSSSENILLLNLYSRFVSKRKKERKRGRGGRGFLSPALRFIMEEYRESFAKASLRDERRVNLFNGLAIA